MTAPRVRGSTTGPRPSLAHAPYGVETAEPARVADSRPAIEECSQATKNECGLDEYEVRRCPDRYRHITLARDCCMIG